MKKLKKNLEKLGAVISVMLIAVSVIILTPCAKQKINLIIAKSEIDSSLQTGVEYEYKKYDKYWELNDVQKTIYKRLYSACLDVFENDADSIDFTIVGIEYNNTDIRKVLDAFKIDYPYLSNPLVKNGTYTYYSHGEFEITFSDCIAKENDTTKINEEILNKYRSAWQNAKAIAKTTKDMSQSKKFETFMKYLDEQVSYDSEVSKKIKSGIKADDYDVFMSQNFVAAFDDDPETDFVCAGYAASFSLLCDLSGIDNVYNRTGITETVSGKTSKHAWNVVYTEDNKYVIDCTQSSVLKKVSFDTIYTVNNTVYIEQN